MGIKQEHEFLTELCQSEGLLGYAMVLTRNRVQAEDLVQETYVRALAAADRLWEGSRIKAWLFTILRNLWFNELRRRRVDPVLYKFDDTPFDVESLAGKMQNPYDILSSEEDAVMVRQALERLPSEAREVLILREYEELSYQEIAQVLGCPIGTVMSRLARARGRLRTVLLPLVVRRFRTRSTPHRNS